SPGKATASIWRRRPQMRSRRSSDRRTADRPAHLGCYAKRSKSHLRRGWPALNQASRAALRPGARSAPPALAVILERYEGSLFGSPCLQEEGEGGLECIDV